MTRSALVISAVINTLNSAATIREAIGSLLPWVDEVVVVDMHSDDDTVRIASSMGARVILHERVGYVEPARAASVAAAKGDWIMILDSDEVVPLSLSERLRELALASEADVVSIPTVTYFFGRIAMGGGWHPNDDAHLRFFRKDALRFSPQIHSTPGTTPGARMMTLEYKPGLAVVHFAYGTVAGFVERMNRYTTLEASQADPDVPAFRHVARGAVRDGWRRYVEQRGFRDGFHGIALALLMTMYSWLTWLKRYERKIGLSEEAVRAAYLAEARRLVEEYPAEAGPQAAISRADTTSLRGYLTDER
jgi:glycosyltransferase involved in cell wall biosynthesis